MASASETLCVISTTVMPSLVAKLVQRLADVRLDVAIQRGERLVQDHQPRRPGKTPRQRQPLQLAAGNLRRQRVQHRVQPEQRRQVADARPAFLFVPVAVFPADIPDCRAPFATGRCCSSDAGPCRPRRRAGENCGDHSMRPAVGPMMRAIIFPSVLLPQPLAPISATTEPCSIASSKPGVQRPWSHPARHSRRSPRRACAARTRPARVP